MKDISLMQDVAQRVKNVQRILQAMKLDACILSTGVNIFLPIR